MKGRLGTTMRLALMSDIHANVQPLSPSACGWNRYRRAKCILGCPSGYKTASASFFTHLGRWLKAMGMHCQPSPMAAQSVEAVPIVMVAMPHKGVTDTTLYSLRMAVQRTLGTRLERLAEPLPVQT